MPPPLKALMPMFTCPLSQVVMRDPVVAVDGYSYEREAIHDFLFRCTRTSAPRWSPMAPLMELTYSLVPNINLHRVIKETLRNAPPQPAYTARTAGWLGTRVFQD